MPADFVQRGRQLVQQAQFQEAVKVCRLGLLAHPTQLEGRLVLGAALMALRRYDEVLAEMRVALELDPAHPRALALKGEALLCKGDALAATELLAKAGAADPADPVINQLYQAARNALNQAPRAPSEPLGDHTGHYPLHRGQDGPSAGVGSGQVTRPHVGSVPSHEMETVGGVPSPDILAVGDGTMEIDPVLDAVEVEAIDAPTAIEPPSGEHTVDQSLFRQRHDPSEIEIGSGDMFSVVEDNPTSARAISGDPFDPAGLSDEVVGFDSAYAGLKSDPTAAYNGPRPFRGERFDDPIDQPTNAIADPYDRLRAESEMDFSQPFPEPDEPSIPSMAFPSDLPIESFRPRDRDPRREQTRSPPRAPAGRADIDDLFPEDDDGVSKLEILDPVTGEPQRELGGRSRDRGRAPMHTIGGLPPMPEAQRSPYPPIQRPRDAGPGPSPRNAPGQADMPSRPGLPHRSRTEDMRTIRQALGVDGSEQGQRPVPAEIRAKRPPSGPPPDEPRHSISRTEPGKRKGVKKKRRRGVPLIVYALLALGVVGGAVFAGFKFRDARLEGQIQEARNKAERALRVDTYRAYVNALKTFTKIAEAKSTPDNNAAVARITGAIALEYGERLDDAVTRTEALGSLDSADALVARAYVALAQHNAEEATKQAGLVLEKFPGDEVAHYLSGRAALLAEDPTAAAEEFRKAIAATRRPVFYLGLARAEAQLGESPEALAALSRAVEPPDGIENHPAATILVARLLAQAGKLPKQVGDPEGSLEKIMAQGSKPLEEQETGVAPGEVGWAALVLAEVKLARGDFGSAKDALSLAQKNMPPDDALFMEALAASLIQVGNTGGAKDVTERAAQRWPKRTATYVSLAQIALAEDQPVRALDSLERAGDISKSPAALAVRGRALLLSGRIGEAKKDLDAALKVQPNLREALLARAEVDLENGDPRSALKILDPLWGEGGDSKLGVVYARALRESNRMDEARLVVTRLLSGPGGARAHIELGRIEARAGNYEKAREAYVTAIEMAPNSIEPRLEAAALGLDSGDALGARESLDALRDQVPQNGAVLVEAARVHTLTGDTKGAAEMLDAAVAATTAPTWRVERERGRQALAESRYDDAIQALDRAKAKKADDTEIRLLLVEAYARNGDKAGLIAEREAITKEFNQSSAMLMARGRSAFLDTNYKEALSQYRGALTRRAQEKATPRSIAEAEYWIGRCHREREELADAEKVLRSAVGHDASNADALYVLASVLAEQNQNPQALAFYEKSVAVNPTANPIAHFYIGEAYSQVKGKDARAVARKAFEKYLEVAPGGDYVEDATRMLRKLK